MSMRSDPRFLVFTVLRERELPPAGAQLYIISKDSQVLSDHGFIVAYIVGRAEEREAPGIQDRHLVGKLESELHVLLHEHDRLALGLQPGNRAPDLRHDERREAL